MRTNHPRRGIVFLVAIVSLVVMLFIGVMFIGQATQQLRIARKQLDGLHALAMADAGIHYMRWVQRYSGTEGNGSPLAISTGAIPYPEESGIDPDELKLGFAALDREFHDELVNYMAVPNLNSGGQDQGGVWIFKYNVLNDDGTTKIVGYQVISEGYYRDSKRTVRAVLMPPPGTIPTPPDPPEGENPPPPPQPLVFDFPLFGDASLNLRGNVTVEGGSIGSNGFIAVSGGSANINAGAKAGGLITDKHNKIKGTKVQNLGHFLDMPDIDLAAYRAYAERTPDTSLIVNGDFNPKSFTNIDKYNFIYVKGQVKLNGNYSFTNKVTIVSEGGMHVNGNVKAINSPMSGNTVGLTLITPGSIIVNGGADIQAVILARNIQYPVNADGVGNATIYGAVLADNVDGGGSFKIYYRRPPADQIILPPPPPSTGGGETIDPNAEARKWNIASWERI